MINCAAGHECIGPTGSAGVGNPTKASPFTHYVGRNWHPGHGRVRGLTSRDVDAVSEALAGRRDSISVTPMSIRQRGIGVAASGVLTPSTTSIVTRSVKLALRSAFLARHSRSRPHQVLHALAAHSIDPRPGYCR
jgi:hypothetical protein